MKIQSHDFQLLDEKTLELTLPFRKTDQCGSKPFTFLNKVTDQSFITLEIKPFVLPRFPEEMAHLGPVHTYADWISASKINEGYVFCKLGARGHSVQNKGTPMVRICS